jgi:hypothetical protein
MRRRISLEELFVKKYRLERKYISYLIKRRQKRKKLFKSS